jgi:cytochrome c biogenesis protein
VKVSKFLTARATVITLFTAISAALLLASSIPQRASLGEKAPDWVGKLPNSLHFVSSLLGIDNIVGTVWFAVLVTLFWLSLVLSTLSQYTATRALVRRMPSSSLPQGHLRIDHPLESFAGVVKSAGYRPAGSANGVYRFVKNRAGYWGNFLLHIGLVTSVVFSLIYVLTQHRVMIRLVGQEITRLSPENARELRGLLTLKQRIPYSVVLKTLEPRYWANDKLEYLSSELYFTDKAGDDPQRVDVALSDKSEFGPYLVYQANAFGRVFELDFVSPSGTPQRERFFLPYPARRDIAGYGEMSVTGTDYLLKGKFFADSERTSIKLHQPTLTLRLYRGKEFLQEVTLVPGGGGQLGPFAVRLAQSEWWTDILLDGSRGTAGIFAGFAIILAGVLSSYCLVPREIIVWQRGGTLHVQHLVRRFAGLYREEFDDIMMKAHKTGES